jgi:uncharacterized membrane protein YhaH (DUF805 family)
MEWMLMPFRKFAQFGGRSRRKEYWMWVLFIVIVSTVIRIVEGMLGLTQAGIGGAQNYSVGVGGNGPLSGLFGLVVLIPGLAVTARRLHDINRSALWMLVPLGTLIFCVTMFVGSIMSGSAGGSFGWAFAAIGLYFLTVVVMIVFLCFDGTKGENRFGADPKSEQNIADVFA